MPQCTQNKRPVRPLRRSDAQRRERPLLSRSSNSDLQASSSVTALNELSRHRVLSHMFHDYPQYLLTNSAGCTVHSSVHYNTSHFRATHYKLPSWKTVLKELTLHMPLGIISSAVNVEGWWSLLWLITDDVYLRHGLNRQDTTKISLFTLCLATLPVPQIVQRQAVLWSGHSEKGAIVDCSVPSRGSTESDSTDSRCQG